MRWLKKGLGSSRVLVPPPLPISSTSFSSALPPPSPHPSVPFVHLIPGPVISLLQASPLLSRPTPSSIRSSHPRSGYISPSGFRPLPLQTQHAYIPHDLWGTGPCAVSSPPPPQRCRQFIPSGLGVPDVVHMTQKRRFVYLSAPPPPAGGGWRKCAI